MRVVYIDVCVSRRDMHTQREIVVLFSDGKSNPMAISRNGETSRERERVDQAVCFVISRASFAK